MPAGLIEAVGDYRARVLVLGAAATAPPGRFAAGPVAERLLHSSPVPLALAPRGWAGQTPPTRLTCAWAGPARSGEALVSARATAGRWGVPVRLVTFVPEPVTVPPAAPWPDPGPAPETVLAEGPGWEGAMAAVAWESGDVLVLGSSRLGPAGRVSLGSAAAEILRVAPVPVLVVPRGADGTPSHS
ncbi:universal stress protein family protein [Modestobacter roseus]|uniref:Universal stress protein family protein n=1 Tax=Modestobacter roseus TaxID=1181884 RepID=A0A562IWG4_9ACTN|nr:universal stress protein [Modestobacter roseus]TWH75401.1 universal stress protein family protein [Modestobacter roseus]